MAKSTTFDTSDMVAALRALKGDAKTSLARSMAVAGGTVLRDEAKARAPVGSAGAQHNVPGALRAAIYLAFRDGQSNDSEVKYAVTWNAKKAPHGHLLEFGHWQIYRVLKLPDGRIVSDLSTKLPKPKWVASHPFLRPALDTAGGRAVQAMIERGRQRLPEILAEIKK